MSLTACGLLVLVAQVGSVPAPNRFLSSKQSTAAIKPAPPAKLQKPSMHDRDEALRSSMRSMMADGDDDDVWYGEKPRNGLIQTGGSAGMSLDDEYMQ